MSAIGGAARRQQGGLAELLGALPAVLGCLCVGQPESRGELEVNPARGWKIENASKCRADPDTVESNGILIETYCDVAATTVRWRAGSACGACCACPDGATVDIDVEASRN